MKDFLTAREIVILQEAHHSSRLRKNADRIKTILFLNEGFSYQETAKLLMLNEGIIRRHEKEYQKTGVDGYWKIITAEAVDISRFYRSRNLHLI